MIEKLLDVNISEVTDDNRENAVDFSTLNGVASCPMKGIVRNVLGKKFKEGEERNMALEAGDLSHKVYVRNN